MGRGVRQCRDAHPVARVDDVMGRGARHRPADPAHVRGGRDGLAPHTAPRVLLDRPLQRDESRIMRSIFRGVVNVAVAGAIVGVAALAVLWLHDRGRRWERPSWPDVSFVSLRASGEEAAGPLSVVAVHPGCPHSTRTVARLAADWPARHPHERLAALVIDTPSRPPERVWRAIPVAAVWWDPRGVWRARWGHRLYGERMCFDADGRYLRTIAADAADDVSMNEGASEKAPADSRR